MKTYITALIGLLILALPPMQAQTDYQKDILGVWELVEKKIVGFALDMDILIEPPRTNNEKLKKKTRRPRTRAIFSN